MVRRENKKKQFEEPTPAKRYKGLTKWRKIGTGVHGQCFSCVRCRNQSPARQEAASFPQGAEHLLKLDCPGCDMVKRAKPRRPDYGPTS